ncbi:MAG: FAD-dependent oxidoreductase [Sphingomonadaceae bacterium]|nr:FAD-dependent oxidoreductase [Sphingomonadaceae bacterium]
MEITRRQAVAAAGASLLGGALASGKASAADARAIADVVVVGAGVFGAWTAWHLKRRGLKVVLLDAYAPGNARSSSGGESRVIRLSYGGDPLYSAMARESLTAWAALSDRQTLPLLHRTGVLWFSPAGDDYMARSMAWLKANGIAHLAGDTAWLRARYPQIMFKDGESGFLEEASGALIAGRGVQTVVADAGLTAQRVQAGLPERLSDGTLRVGGVLARSVVYACGPWLAKLFPDLLGGRIVATRQEVYHFGPAAGDGRFSPPALPVWADFNAGDIVYGFPGLEGQGFKIAFDRHGAEVDPDSQDRRVSSAGVDAARAYLAQRFPGLANAPFVHGRVCQYENSSNGDFLIDRLPGFDRVWLVGGGSGHGFKHGPAVGARVARHVADSALPVEPRFSLASKAAVQKRTVY